MEESLPPASQKIPPPSESITIVGGPEEPINNPLDAIGLLKLAQAKKVSPARLAAYKKRFHKSWEKEREKEARKALGKKYEFRPAWVVRNTPVPPEFFEKIVKRDVQLKKLNALLTADRKAAKKALRERWLRTHLPPRERRLEALKAKAFDIAKQLAEVDAEIQKVKTSIAYQIGLANIQRPLEVDEIQKKIRIRIEQVRRSCALQIAGRERQKMMMQHGLWRVHGIGGPMTLEQLMKLRESEIKEQIK